MNNELAFGTVSLQNLNFQRIEARVNSLRAIGVLYDCIVLGALRGLLSSVNNTADGVQGVGLANLILERGFKVRSQRW